ncbi:MAG: DNA mismatch repair endonuclease MutL [Clostridiaceae bacterium]|nr:DNA mismatch repair endonuclease MutL [Clostridiaceae bacterium]
MGKIITLDEGTVKKIAAGEVVENPASVVKELVENSIDAGASRITVEIKKGGISFIKVTDNGSGIEEDDIAKVFKRHSTSKIRNAEDIYFISSLGFRGEALASIAAVSRVELITRAAGTPYGLRVYSENGIIKDMEKTGSPQGTTVIVRDLFYNTPARFKFLKKDSVESGYVSDIVTRIALSNPSISLSLSSDGKIIIQTPGTGDLSYAIASIYGMDTGKSIIKINYKDELVHITGYAGRAEISRPSRKYQSIFVNGRYVRSKVITSAIDEAYNTYLVKNKYAFIVLNIKINPVAVDVNVHPAKLEVKFSDEQRIYRAVYHAVKNALSGESRIIEIKTDEALFFKESNRDIIEKEPGLLTGGPGQIYNAGEPCEEGTRDMRAWKDSRHDNLVYYRPDSRQEGRHVELDASRSDDGQGRQEDYRQDYFLVDDASGDFSGSRIIGQAFSTYILLEKDDYLLLVDQHAAHERIVFEEMKKQFSENKSMAQELIVPITINMTYQEIKILDENKAFFNRLGYIYEEFGNNSIIVRAVPYGGCCENEEDMFLELLDIASSNRKENISILAEKAIYQIACKAAVKANMNLDNKEIAEMLKKLSALENLYTCPHGRPAVVKITRGELEKMFKRKL